MPTQKKSQADKGKTFGGQSVFGGEAAVGSDMATVAHGHYREQLPVAGMTVAQIRKKFGTRMDIDPTAKAILDGSPVGEDTVINHKQLLLFARVAGEKGAEIVNGAGTGKKKVK